MNWAKLAGPSAMNDGLISGSLHFAAQGAPSLITLWDKTNGQIKGLSAITTYPLYLVTRNPKVKTIKDFSAKDKIAVPSIKISTQAIMLQMAAAKAFGEQNYGKLDPLTVRCRTRTRRWPSSTTPPASTRISRPRRSTSRRSRLPGAHLITTSYEILGGPATALVITANAKFRDGQPEGLQGLLRGVEGGDRHHQQGQARRPPSSISIWPTTRRTRSRILSR